jgi:putative MFS transporter
LLVQLLGITPSRAAFLMIFVNLAGLFGRIGLSYLSDAIGRKGSGAIASFGSAILLVSAAVYHNVYLGAVSLFWLLLILYNAFGDGGFAIVGPYAAELWPASLRTTGMGSAYGFGGIGKVIGPWGLALIVGSTNMITPKASVAALLPAYTYLAAWFALAGITYVVLGIETKGRSLESIEQSLGASQPADIVHVKVEENR